MSVNPDWHDDTFPELRAQPPWVMQEMIAAEPALVETLLRTPVAGLDAAAAAIDQAVRQQLPVTICGCGTSEHAAQGVAAMLAHAAGPTHHWLVRSAPAFAAAGDPLPGVCVAVSHDGDTRATVAALAAARSAGARTIAITHRPDSPVARATDVALITPTHDDSWCHTVAYTSAIAVGASLAAARGMVPASPAAARALLEHATDAPGVRAIAGRLADRRVILCAGAGTDLVTTRELALKIAEATHVPTIALELETVLHGQLVATEPTDALVLVAMTPSAEQARVSRRLADASIAARTIGLRVAGLFSSALDLAPGEAAELAPDGTVHVPLPPADQLDTRLAGLLAGAGTAQRLTLEIAHVRGTNPDLIRREQEPYRLAAAAAETPADG